MLASVFIATSLDGFIAREDGGLDWLPMGTGEDHGFDAFFSGVDAVVMGRATFEKVLTFGVWPYGDRRVVVLTSQPERIVPPPGATCDTMSGAPGDIVARLDRDGVRHAYIDGGVTIQRFLEAGLVARLIITRIPVLLGRGIPLFGPLPHDVALTHVATRAFPSGLVQSEYRRSGEK